MSRTRTDPASTEMIATAIGASRSMRLSGSPAQGPLGLLQLRAEVVERLRSSGGRPTDPSWTLKRVVPFRRERWQELEALARKVSTEWIKPTGDQEVGRSRRRLRHHA